ncbi:MAG: phenylalanine--tRNA ligase subunit alpha, partial [Deltaproteobacteria bacterium]|nr:phenylalanine--tRNA ligase subunit alpha [Deltaproteobacteria bacterium]
MEVDLGGLRDRIKSRLAEINDDKTLREFQVEYTGKKGVITSLLKEVKNVPPEKRKDFGQEVNSLKGEIEGLIERRAAEILKKKIEESLSGEIFDISFPGKRHFIGKIHPLTIVQRKIERIFESMGFHVLDYPEVESEFNNFEGLNIPADHPARDMQDTFWLTDGNLLRTHTSAGQVRSLKEIKPPFMAIFPGRVFRFEATDASHEHTFHQVEGLMIDRRISVANLLSSMMTLLEKVLEREVKVRLRPGYFPFVEPGFELDISCMVCGGKGCSVCKQ